MKKILALVILIFAVLRLQAQQKTADVPVIATVDQQKLVTAFKEYVDAANAAENARLKFVATKFELMATMKVSPQEFDLIPDGEKFTFKRKEINAQQYPLLQATPTPSPAATKPRG